MHSNPLALYIDDDENDRVLVQHAAESAKIDLEIRCPSGIPEAMDYVGGRGQFADREKHPLPALILLDYHLNGRTGPEFLYWLRGRPRFTAIPVCVCSDTDLADPIARSYRAGGDHFLRKPTSFKRLEAILRALAPCIASTPPAFDLLVGLPEYRVICSPA
jgi:CheY-like chemotaxis protein